MQPSEEMLVEAVKGAPEGWAVIAIALVAVVLIVAKLMLPPITQSRERVKMREMDIREKEAANDAARIEANKALAEQTRAATESVDALAIRVAAQTARLDESAGRSHDMGCKVDAVKESTDRIRDTTDATKALVQDIHRRVVGGEGTD